MVELLLLPGLVLAIVVPLAVGVVVERAAAQRRRRQPEPPGAGPHPPTVLALASVALALLTWPAGVSMIWMVEGLVSGGLLAHPPGPLTKVAMLNTVPLLALACGTAALYRARRWEAGRGAIDLARAGLVLSSWACLFMLLPLTRAVQRDGVERADRDACGRNVAKLVAAMELYLADNDGVFPPGERWCERIWPHLKGDLESNRSACDYGFNAKLAGRKRGDLKEPSRLVLIFDTDPNPDGSNVAGGRERLPEVPHHRYGDTYGFADGQHRWLPRSRSGLTAQGEITWSKECEADWVRWEP